MQRFEVMLIWANGEREESAMFASSLEEAEADAENMVQREEDLTAVLFAGKDY